MTRSIPQAWSAQDARQLIIAIDRSFVEVDIDSLGTVSEKLTTGAASKVALASYAAAVEQGKAAAYVCAAKTDYERQLARRRNADGQRVPYKTMYDGKEVNIYFCDIPKTIYDTARDEFFSAHMWFWLQRQRHPKIRRPFEMKMFEAHRLANRYMAEVVDEIAQPRAIVDSHDTHVAMLGRELNLRGRSDLFKRLVVHTAFPPAHFVEAEITETHSAGNPPDAMSEPELVEWMNAIGENDVVSTSGLEWSKNLGAVYELLWRRNPETCRPIDRLKIVTAPVPVDVRQLRSEFLESQKSVDGQPSKHTLVEDQIKYARPEDKPGERTGRRRVVTVAGRDEAYKNIDKFILAMEKLLSEPGYEDVICPLLISPTRENIRAYREKFAFDTGLAQAANERLGREAFRVVNGKDRATVVAWMYETDINVTLARDDGFNWMAVEPTATHIPGPDEVVPERTWGPVQVLSRTMGVTQALERQLRERGLELAQLFYAVLPEVVTYRVAHKNSRWGQDGFHPAKPRGKCDDENRKLELETAAVVEAVRDGLLSLDPERDNANAPLRQRQSREIERMLADNTPGRYVQTLDRCVEAAVARRVKRIRGQLEDPAADVLPGEALWLDTRGLLKDLSDEASWKFNQALNRDLDQALTEVAFTYDAYYPAESDWSVEPHLPNASDSVATSIGQDTRTSNTAVATLTL